MDPNKIIERLKEKSKLVEWHKEDRKEYYGVFAKSFSKKSNENDYFLFDLKSMEDAVRKNVDNKR